MRNKTRKFLSILLCFSMAIGMTGCTKKIKKEPGSQSDMFPLNQISGISL